MRDDLEQSRRAPKYSAYDEDASDRRILPEHVLWAVVLKRSLADAKGLRVGSDPETGNSDAKRSARRWFRRRRRDYIGGWGYVIDALDLPPSRAAEIEQAAKTTGGTLETLFGFGFDEQLLQD